MKIRCRVVWHKPFASARKTSGGKPSINRYVDAKERMALAAAVSPFHRQVRRTGSPMTIQKLRFGRGARTGICVLASENAHGRQGAQIEL
jgi:hypothetical protein